MTDHGTALIAPDPSWSTAELLERAEGCTSLSPAWLAPLAALDPVDLLPDDRLPLALLLQRMTAVTEAVALRALAMVPERTCVPDPALRSSHPSAAARMCPGGGVCTHRWEVDEIAALTGLPRWVMDRRRALSWQLAEGWSALLPLLAAGRITLGHLHGFSRATLNSSAEALAAAVEGAVEILGRNPHASAESLTRSVRRIVARHTEPAEATRKHRDRVREETGVSFVDLADGVAALTVTGETHKLEAIRALVSEHPSVTRPDSEDGRTRGQRECDLLVSLCLSGSGYGLVGQPATGPDGSEPDSTATARAAAPRVGVIITTSMESLLGLSNEPGTVGDTVISAAIVRHWAADPAWARRAVTDDHGLIRTISRVQRSPAQRLRMAVGARWPRCTFPGCTRAARASQIDHAEAHSLGGETVLDNLHPLCLRHHRMKDQPGFYVRLGDDGTAVWTLPSGRRISVAAADHRARPGPHDGKPDRVAEPPALPDDDFGGSFDAWVERQLAADPMGACA